MSERLKRHSWLVGFVGGGLGLVVNGVRLYAVAERNLDSIAVIINLVAIPVGVGIVVGGGTWLTASALIWRREAKREEERKRLEAEKHRREQDLLKFKGFTLRESVRRCSELLIMYECGTALEYQFDNQIDIVLTELNIGVPRDLSFNTEAKRTSLIRFLNGVQQYIDAGDLDGARLRSRNVRTQT